MASEPQPLSTEDEALLDRVATRVVELRMEVPAILVLESAKPLTVVASQSLVFFEPLIQSLFRFSDYRRFTELVERRDVMEALIVKIEAGADAERAKRKQARRAAGGRQG